MERVDAAHLDPAVSLRRARLVASNGDPSDGSFDDMAGVAVDEVDRLPAGVVAETVPRQTHAVFTHHVQSNNLHEELQPTDPEHGKGFLEICVPVRAQS